MVKCIPNYCSTKYGICRGYWQCELPKTTFIMSLQPQVGVEIYDVCLVIENTFLGIDYISANWKDYGFDRGTTIHLVRPTLCSGVALIYYEYLPGVEVEPIDVELAYLLEDN